MNSLLKILDYVFLTRPVLFIPGWNTLLAGFLVSREQGMFEFFLKDIFPSDMWHFCLVFCSFTLAMAGSFVFNQLQDIDSDRKNNKLLLFSDNHISVRSGYWTAFILSGLSLLFAALNGTALLAVILVFLLITAYSYNYPPFILKNRPVGGALSNIAMGALAFACGWIAEDVLNLSIVLQMLPFLFFNTLLYLLTTLPDRIGDQMSGKRTVAVQLGVRKTLLLAGILFIPALSLSIGLKSILTVVIVIFFPFLLYMLIQQTAKAGFTVCKTGILLFTILIALFFPVYAVLPLLIFSVSRFYYRKRFDLEYPNLKGQ